MNTRETIIEHIQNLNKLIDKGLTNDMYAEILQSKSISLLALATLESKSEKNE